MKKEEIEKLFPKVVTISLQMIKNVDLLSATDCIGARALKSILPVKDLKDLRWRIGTGFFVVDKHVFVVKTAGTDLRLKSMPFVKVNEKILFTIDHMYPCTQEQLHKYY